MKRLIAAAALIVLAACTKAETSTNTNTEPSSATAATETSSTAVNTSSTTGTTATTSSTATDTTGTTGSAAGTASIAPAATATTASDSAKAASKKKESKKMSNENEAQVAELHTTAGEIDIRFFPDVAPNHVKNFLTLASQGFYDGIKFHRIIPGFMIQAGDPNTKSGPRTTWGTGGSPNKLKAEFNAVHHARGIVSAARTNDPNSASSQFFICVADAGFLDRQYTAFGQVVKGMDVADKIVNGKRNRDDQPDEPVSITSIKLRPATAAEQGPAPVQ